MVLGKHFNSDMAIWLNANIAAHPGYFLNHIGKLRLKR